MGDLLGISYAFTLNPNSRPKIQVRVDRPEEATMIPGMDGFWLGPNGPRNQSVSAVVAAQNLYAWSVASKAPGLFRNPWAEHDLGSDVPFMANHHPQRSRRNGGIRIQAFPQ